MSVYGGTSTGLQIKDLNARKPQIVVGTPGRVTDLIERGVLKFDNTKFVILDEKADEMLDMDSSMMSPTSLPRFLKENLDVLGHDAGTHC